MSNSAVAQSAMGHMRQQSYATAVAKQLPANMYESNQAVSAIATHALCSNRLVTIKNLG